MKKTIKAISLAACLCLLLCSCASSAPVSDDTSLNRDSAPTEIMVEQNVVEPSIDEFDSTYRISEEERSSIKAEQEARESAEKSVREAEEARVSMEIENRSLITPVTHEKISFEWNGSMYEGIQELYGDKEVYLKHIVSDKENVEIVSYVPQYGDLTGYDDLSIQLDCPNLKEVTIGEGYRTFNIVETDSDLYRAETLYLPSDFLFFEYVQNGQHYTYDENKGASLSAFPLGFSDLREIHVMDNQRMDFIWSAEGMLYTRRVFGTNIQSVLTCVPQNYQTLDGTVTLPQQATIIQTHAVYQCRNIKRLVIPESTKLLETDAILGSEENPLTVICSRGSAAEAYVKQFGELYHLQLAYG